MDGLQALNDRSVSEILRREQTIYLPKGEVELMDHAYALISSAAETLHLSVREGLPIQRFIEHRDRESQRPTLY